MSWTCEIGFFFSLFLLLLLISNLEGGVGGFNDVETLLKKYENTT